MNMKLSEIKPNPSNPRIIKDEKFAKLVQSIKDFPQMLELRLIGGNMGLRACEEAGLKEVPVMRADDLTPEQQAEFIIKDNFGFGEWDWDMLANQWDADGDKAPFQQMTFTLADEQAEVIQQAIADIKQTEEYKYAETMGNENSNGNALYLIVMQWAGQGK
jgi:ParB-like chromosome segregation protein Spo0J